MDEQTLSSLFGAQTLQDAERGDARAVGALLKGAAPHAGEIALARLLADYYQDEGVPLGDDTRAVLIEKLVSPGIAALDEADFNRVNALVRAIDLPAQMDRVDTVLKGFLYPKMAAWDALAEAEPAWDNWDQARKLQYGRKFARLFCLVANIPQAEIGSMSEERDAQGRIIAARCVPLAQGRVRVELNEAEDIGFKDIRQFHANLYHELTHGVQMHLLYCANHGLSAGLPVQLRTTGMLLNVLLHKRFYHHDFESQESYESNPLEVHAERNAVDFADSIHDPEKRAALVRRHAIIQSSNKVSASAPRR